MTEQLVELRREVTALEQQLAVERAATEAEKRRTALLQVDCISYCTAWTQVMVDLACSQDVDDKNAYRILVEKPVGKCLLWEMRRIWGDSIKTNIREIECEDLKWIKLA